MDYIVIQKGSTDVTTYHNYGAVADPANMVYIRQRAAAVNSAVTLLGSASDAHTDNRGIQVDTTNAEQLIRVDWPDAAFATGVDYVILGVRGTATYPHFIMCHLVAYNPLDAVRLGMTALPNAVANAAGGLPISAAGALALDTMRSEVAAILVDTGTTLDGRLPAALVGGRMDSSLGALAANSVTASALAADAVTEIQSGLATAAALTAVDDFLDTEIAAIKAKTDNLPSDPADASVIAGLLGTMDAKLDTIDNFLDTEMASVAATQAKLDTALVLDGAVYRFTTNALSLAPLGSVGFTAATVGAEILKQDWTGVNPTSVFCLLNMGRMVVNKKTQTTGYLNVMKEDGVTTAYQIPIVTASLPSAQVTETGTPI